MANNAALLLSVSKTVSTNSRSTPPSIKALVCSEYALTKSLNVTERYPGLFTSGDNEPALLVGPMAPATNLGFSGVKAVCSSATFRAIFAASRFISVTRFSMA